MTSKAERIDQIKTLLLKARPESGSTEAERESSRAMAYRLMEKHSITKEEILGPSREKPRVEQKTNKHSNSPYANRYEYYNGWYYYDVPPSYKDHLDFHKLNVSFSNAVKDLKGLYFEVGNSGKVVRSNNPELLFRYELELRTRINRSQARERDEAFARKVKEMTAEREKAKRQREKEDAAFMKNMVLMCASALIVMLLIAIL